MDDEILENKSHEIPLKKVLRDEFQHLRPDAAQVNENAELSNVLSKFHEGKLTALCFSGGGIRSATFGLGIVQALAKEGWLEKFDYLSTVSGGGYLGSWLSAWIWREQIDEFESESNKKRHDLKEELKKANERYKDKSAELERLQNSTTAPAAGVIETLKIEIEKEQEQIEINKFKIDNLEQNLHEKFNSLNSDGIEAVQQKLSECTVPVQPKARLQSPNPEPKQMQFLREYSNYMSPKVGLLSADTWTLLAIYARNLFLNWTIFIPLLCAALLLPRILLEVAKHQVSPSRVEMSWLLLLGLIAGIVAVILTVAKLPSKNKEGESSRLNTDVGVFGTVILPLLLMAYAATTFWGWSKIQNVSPSVPYEFLKPYLAYEYSNFLIFSVAVFIVGNAIYFIYAKIFRGADGKFPKGEFAVAFFSSFVGGSLTWLVAKNVFDSNYFKGLQPDDYRLPIYICLAVPLYLICFSIGSALFAGIYSRYATDEDREWLARQGAWILIVSGAWIVVNAIVLIAPYGLQKIIETLTAIFTKSEFDWKQVFSLVSSIVVAVSGFISLVGGFSGESLVKKDPNPTKLNKFLAFAPQIAAVIFLGSIFIGLAYVSEILLRKVNFFLKDFTALSFANFAPNSWIDYWLICFIFLGLVGTAMAFVINVNKFSLHAAYRDRLIRAYLGASNTRRKGDSFTGFDDADNFQLHRLKGQKPFHVINATLNLVNGKNLAWQNRKAASFTMSPLHCGNWLLGYRRTNEYCRNGNLSTCGKIRFCNRRDEPCASTHEGDCQLKGKSLRLGTAMTISGAAANPNMGYYSSSVVTFLMTLFNIRLGWWLGNTGEIGEEKDWFGYGKNQFYKKASPSVAILPLLNETFGRTDESKKFLNVTDGGHFENLGIYEMILRRCKLIVLSDAAADEKFTWGEISNAIEKCRVDLGVEIKFNKEIDYLFSRHTELDEKDKKEKRRFAIAKIEYPEKDSDGRRFTGHLIYIRPTYYGSDEPTPVRHYANANQSFPHQSTGDQLYDEKQFEAYRSLGFHIMSRILERDQVEGDTVEKLFNQTFSKTVEKRQNGNEKLAQPLPELFGSESSDAV